MLQSGLLIFLAMLLTFPFTISASESSKKNKDNYCLSHREFITTLEYMRKQDHYKMGEVFSRDVAHQVSKGCTGAAQRFVRVYELLVKVEAGARSSAQFAVEMAKLSDDHVNTFMGVFKNAYEPKKLDLDVLSSVKIARRLSSEYQGNVSQALKDYEELVKFCLNGDEMGGSAAQCALLASDLATAGETHKEPISRSFKKLYTYLRTHEKTGLSMGQAMNISKKVVGIHPKAIDNFIAAYEYGLKNSGLDIPADQSLQFALNISNRAVDKTIATENVNRLPASK